MVSSVLLLLSPPEKTMTGKGLLSPFFSFFFAHGNYSLIKKRKSHITNIKMTLHLCTGPDASQSIFILKEI